MASKSNRPATRPLTPRQTHFAGLIVGGKSQADAWRIAFNHPKSNARRAAEASCRAAAKPAVIAEVARLRAKADAKVLLSLDDRLGILGRDAQRPGDSPAMINARARAIEVYNKTAGDHAPERTETIIKGDPANPVTVATVPLSKRAKIAALAATRAPRS